MTPTADLRIKLRKLLNEQVPTGKTEADTRFLDSELDDLLTESTNIYAAASAGWTMKAGMLSEELGEIEEYSVGQERYKKVNLTTAINAAMAMAKQYAEMARKSTGSLVLKLSPPEVL